MLAGTDTSVAFGTTRGAGEATRNASAATIASNVGFGRTAGPGTVLVSPWLAYQTPAGAHPDTPETAPSGCNGVARYHRASPSLTTSTALPSRRWRPLRP